MKLKPSIFVLGALLFFTLETAHTQNTPVSFPRLEPDPKALEYHRLGASGYTWTDYAEISLWASGDTSLSNLGRIQTAVSSLNSSSELPSAGKERAEFILTYMHRNILRSYSFYQTRIDAIFTNGGYNCVSSAVLYMILCESAGIRSSGVITKDHAFVMVYIDGQEIDVETTNRYGFDPGNRREFHDQFGRLGFTYVPAQNYRDRQTISKVQLISMILNNRIADHERQNRYADSVPVAIDRAALLLGEAFSSASGITSPETLFEDPGKVIMDRLFNYGASLVRAHREEDGILWAEAASARYADTGRWQEFIMTAVNNRIARFLRERDSNTTSARNFLESKKSVLTEENYAQLDAILADAELLKRANQIRSPEEGNSVISGVQQARDSGRLTERRANELIYYSILKTAAVLCAAPARNWRAAINFIETAVIRFGTNREIEQTLRTYRNNLAADYHNRFAAEWNRKNYDQAELILNEGLSEFPDDRQLLSDRQTVNRNRAR